MNPCAQDGVAPEPDADLGQRPLHPESSVRPSCLHVYGRSAAVCTVCTETRRRDRTITLEFAGAQDDGTYAWHEKGLFQLAPGELAELTALLFRPSKSLRFVHRSSALKTLTLTYQAPNYLLSLTVGSVTRRVPVCPADQFQLRNFLLARVAIAQALPPSVVLQSLWVLAEQLPSTP
jgi:hypothetical protein